MALGPCGLPDLVVGDPLAAQGRLDNAHHLRELTGVAENHPGQAPWVGAMMAFLIEVHHSVKRAKDAGSDAFAPDLLAT